MLEVARRFREKYSPNNVVTVGIGDSPIDQSMLDVADHPIGIPAGGSLNVQIDDGRGIVPTLEGSAGWAEAVTTLLARCGITKKE